MIEVTQNQNVVFALSVPQSVQMLSAVVHDTSLPYRVRRGAALILLPHLRLQERILAQPAQDLAPPVRIREREEDYEIGHEYDR